MRWGCIWNTLGLTFAREADTDRVDGDPVELHNVLGNTRGVVFQAGDVCPHGVGALVLAILPARALSYDLNTSFGFQGARVRPRE